MSVLMSLKTKRWQDGSRIQGDIHQSDAETQPRLYGPSFIEDLIKRLETVLPNIEGNAVV